jgi:hypothetical protein
MSESESEFSAQEKAASVVWRLAHGDGVTVRDVADDMCITRQGAYRLLCTVSRVVPITPDSSGVWRRFDSS